MRNVCRIVILCSICFLLINYVGYGQLIINSEHRDDYDSKVVSDSDENIAIANNQELIDLGLPGNGSEVNPFVLANLTMTYSDLCIEIENTDLYLLIVNCSIDESEVGIKLDNTANIIVNQVSFSGVRQGIEILESRSILVEDCWFEYCSFLAFSIMESMNCTISECRFHLIGEIIQITPTGGSIYTTNSGLIGHISKDEDITINQNVCTHMENAESAFSISYCNNIKFTANQMNDDFARIYFYDCNELEITNNQFTTSFNLEECVGCYFSNNIFNDCTPTITGNLESMFFEVHSNTIDGKDLGIIQDLQDAIIDGETLYSATLISCNNVIVEGGELSRIAPALGLWKCVNCTINAAVISESVVIEKSWNCTIANSTLSESLGVISSDGTSVILCDFSDTDNAPAAILIDNSTYTRCTNNSIISCYGGISLYNSRHTDLIANWIELVENSGININDSMYGTIAGNSILGSEIYGIVLESGSMRFKIYYNIIGWNARGNALDNGLKNIWDDETSRGNNYSNYGGSGIYRIKGDAGSIDHYPSGISPDYWDSSLVESPINQIILLIAAVGIVGVGLLISTYIWRNLAVKRKATASLSENEPSISS